MHIAATLPVQASSAALWRRCSRIAGRKKPAGGLMHSRPAKTPAIRGRIAMAWSAVRVRAPIRMPFWPMTRFCKAAGLARPAQTTGQLSPARRSSQAAKLRDAMSQARKLAGSFTIAKTMASTSMVGG